MPKFAMETREQNLRRTRRRLANEREAVAIGQRGLFGDPSVNQLTDAASRPSLGNLKIPQRASVPCTSRQAFREITTTGKRSGQKLAILEFLRRQLFPMTSFEIARANDWDRVGVARRLPDLAADGLVERSGIRTCQISGRPSLTWRAI
ncbi:MAG: Winged helix-turn-helix protein [Bryobacterales bacterium]|nr:Winged helix-turn-helix protein [Bryobacterales bacterium]